MAPASRPFWKRSRSLPVSTPRAGPSTFHFRPGVQSPSFTSTSASHAATARRPFFFLRAESFFNVATEVERLGVRGYGERSLHEQSHGESFLSLIKHRFGPSGLYILDEPEAALSPSRQLSLLVRMHELVEQGSQFIIATHARIVLAYPGATIYQVDDRGIARVDYDDTEHVRLTRDFLVDRERFLRRLLGQP
jgi:predicted ATPase